MDNFIFIISLFLIGTSVHSLITNKKILIESFGFSLGISLVIIFYLSQLEFVLSFPNFLIKIFYCFALVFSILFFYRNKMENINLKFDIRKTIFTLLIFFNLIFVLIESIIRPLIAWDGIASWFFGGKALYIDGRITSYFYNYANFDFPYLFQSAIAFQSTFNGFYSEKNGLFLFPLIYLSILVLFFNFLRKKTSTTWALIFTFILSSTQILIRHGGYFDHGHIDILLSYFFSGSIISYLIFKEDKSYSSFLIMQFFLIGSFFTKNEGAVFYIIFQFLLLFKTLSIKKKKSIYLLTILFFFLPVVAWFTFKALYLPENYRLMGPYFSNMHLILESLVLMAKEFLNIQRWNLGWVFILASIPLLIKKEKYFDVLMILSLLIAIYILIYFISPIDPINEITSSFDRLLLHIFPSLMLISCITFWDYRKYFKVKIK